MKTVLITGCSSGIGLYCAKALQADGFYVIATVRKEKDREKLTALGINTEQLDLNSSQSIEAFCKKINQYYPTLDLLINNASFAQAGAIEDLSREAMKAQFETNFFGVMELTNRVIKKMRVQNHGQIIFIGSLLGYVTMPFRGAYCASKYALEAMSDALRQELHKTPITISLIEPGPIYSQFRENVKAPFQEHIDRNNSPHQATYKAMEKAFFQTEDKTPFYLAPDAVYQKIKRAINAKNPKARYYVGFPAYLFRLLKKVLPAKCMDKFMLYITKNERKMD